MTKIIKVLGTGCHKCKTMTTLVQEVVSQNNIDVIIYKVEDIMEIMSFNVMVTPTLVINNKTVVKGRVPTKDEILSLLKPENNRAS